jgi:LEA14-like dessication related protein
VVTNIVVANTAASTATATVNIDGTAILSGISIPANSTAFFDVKQTMAASSTAKVISGSASATTVNFHISGVEIV